MKKTALILLLIQFGLNSYSKDWMPFVLDQQSYYQHDNLVEYIFLDSMFSKNDTIFYYFNSKNSNFGDCFEDLTSYDRRGDNPPETGGAYGSEPLSLSKYFTGFHFINDSCIYDRLIFKPFARSGESWVSNGVEFKCISVSDTSLFNEIDSIKTFVAQGNGFVNERFILSKKFGFLLFTPFKNFTKNNPSLLSPLKLIGYSNGSLSKGFSPPSINRIYDYSVADILISRRYRQGIDHGSEFTYYNVDIDSITKVTHYDDSLNIQYVRNTMSYFTSTYGRQWNSDTTYTKSIRSYTYRNNRLINSPTGWCGYLDNLDYEDIFLPQGFNLRRIYRKNAYMLEITNNDTIVKLDITSFSEYWICNKTLYD